MRAIPLVLLLAMTVGCGSMLTTLNNELVLAQSDLEELSLLVDEDTAVILRQVSGLVHNVQYVLGVYLEAGANEPSSLLEAIHQALDASDAVLEEWVPSTETQRKIRVGVLLLRSALRRLEAYVLPPSESSLIGT